MADTLTLDEAVPLLESDDPADNSQLPAEVLGESLEVIEDFREAQESAESERRYLTLDEAAELDFTDDEPTAKSDKPLMIVDGQPLTEQNIIDVYRSARDTAWHIGRINNEYERLLGGAQSVVNASWRLAELVSDRAPEAPPLSLTYTNPSLAIVQRALRDAVDQFISEALGAGGEAQQAAASLVSQRHHELLQAEGAMLLEHIPEARDPTTREQLFEDIKTVATVCGFSIPEIEAVVDHRLFRLAQLAVKGLDAQEREARRPSSRPKRRRKRRSEAMEKLARTGSLDDALAVDFD